MTIEPYRRVLALPGVKPLMFLALAARIPVTAAGLTMTLYVVDGLKLGFTRAGLVGAASTIGMAIGGPVAGRFVDRHGLRPVIGVTTVAQLAFWMSATHLPYWPLLAAAFGSGVLALPVFSVIRQCMAAAVPPERRRTGFAVDSMLVEVSYMIGPAVAVALVTSAGPRWTVALVGLGICTSGVLLFLLNPPTRDVGEPEPAAGPVPRRQWLTPSLLALFAVTAAATFVLNSTELSLVAALKAGGAAQWTGLVISSWCVWSVLGGFVYGGRSRGASPLVLIGAMAALVTPIGLASPWPLLCVAIIPSGALCAPSLAATVDTLTRRVPAGARGEATGLHSTALTLGIAVSGPIAGLVIDRLGVRWAFAVAGLGGLLLVAAAAAFWRRTSLPSDPVTAAAPATTGAA